MKNSALLEKTELFLLDLDGTLYLGNNPIGCVKQTLSRLRAMGKRLVYLTNNSSRTRLEYEEKLRRIGLFGEGDSVFTSAMAAIALLNERFAGKRACVLARDEVKAEFKAAGVLLDDKTPEVCVLCYDTSLTFEKIKTFNEHLVHGAVYIATHPDDVCPTETVFMPDVGSFLAMFERSSGRLPDQICGKPYEYLGECIGKFYAVPKERICMVGDRMTTDIRFANRNGLKSVLVLSGETTRDTIGNYPDTPDLVLPSINEIFG